MFTGIISAIGDIANLEQRGGDVRLTIRTGDLGLADVSVETLNLTTIGNWAMGARINLEKAMQASDRFGGHIVSGHVDGIGEVVSLHEDARSWRFRMRAPSELAKYIAHKGSITVDGTSLTVNIVDGAEFELNIVPHTMLHTVMGDYKVGSKVNLEVDLVARYLERLLLGDKAAETGS
jgi:riboflavin synthase